MTGRSKRRLWSNPNDGLIQTLEQIKQQSDPNDGAIQTTERSKRLSDLKEGAVQTTERSKRRGDPNDGLGAIQSTEGHGAIQTTELSKGRGSAKSLQMTERLICDPNDGAIQTTD